MLRTSPTQIGSKLIAIALTGLALSGTALADNSFKARFAYDGKSSVEQNYARFQKVAKKACITDTKEAGGVANKMRIEADCTARLLHDAVEASGQADLAALHNQQTGATGTLVAAAH
jgi:hypothetical protein